MPAALILASGSRYRRQLLERLRVPFHVFPANSDEMLRAGESPRGLAVRLARAKAETVAPQFRDSCVIGADQVAVCRGKVLGKPETATRNIEQLRLASGQSVEFLTAVCVLRDSDRHSDQHLDVTTVRFRSLTDAEIARYVELEQAFDCAGGFKAEGLGISLLERIDSEDPTALVGLPLIWLAGALRRAGLM
jgi:7-methyl-GTP pyrophosphatase